MERKHKKWNGFAESCECGTKLEIVLKQNKQEVSESHSICLSRALEQYYNYSHFFRYIMWPNICGHLTITHKRIVSVVYCIMSKANTETTQLILFVCEKTGLFSVYNK